MQLRLKAGKDGLFPARGRGSPWPHDFMQMALGFLHKPILLFLGEGLHLSFARVEACAGGSVGKLADLIIPYMLFACVWDN